MLAKFYAFDNIWDVGFRGRDGERLFLCCGVLCFATRGWCCVLCFVLWCGIFVVVADCNGLNS